MSKFKANHLLLFCFVTLALWRGGVVSGDEKPKKAEKGEEVKIYELKKEQFSIKVTNWGATLISLVLPDQHGKTSDIVLGYDKVDEYKTDTTYFGATVGRVANRIAGAKFTLNGTEYKLSANEKKNTLHGGAKGFSDVVWKVDKYKPEGDVPSITFAYHSRDGEEGFPGDVNAKVTYALVKEGLSIKMKADAPKKATPINLAHHTYWNLGGHDSGDILSDEIQIFGSHITPVDKELIPTGKKEPVKGTPFDFLKPAVIGSKIKKLPDGYDINYVLDESPKKVSPAAIVHNVKTGRVMELKTNQPGLQFYTGNYIKDVKGKNGYVYKAHAGLCLESQGFPDAVNHPDFPSQIVTPGSRYFHEMVFKFTIKGKEKENEEKKSSEKKEEENEPEKKIEKKKRRKGHKGSGRKNIKKLSHGGYQERGPEIKTLTQRPDDESGH